MKDLKNKAISIKGKEYVQVKDRLLFLAENYSGKYSIVTEYQYYPERKMWTVSAELTIDGCRFVGHAQELESDDYKSVNFASALENCETSAVGRACAMAGIGVLDSIASVDEVNKAQNRGAVVSQSSNAPATDRQIEYILSLKVRKEGNTNCDADQLRKEFNTYEKASGEIARLKDLNDYGING